MTESSTSVIIPAYNAQEHLARAVQSVLEQDVSPMEILVIDDGSSDDTQGVARSYGRDVSYVYQENQGASAARNHGIRLARGNWVAFLDADDEWLPGRLSSHQQISARNPDLSWLSGAYELMAAGRPRRTLSFPREVGTNEVLPDALAALGNSSSKWQGNVFWTGTITVRKAALEVVTKSGMEDYFDIAQRSSHDLDLWIRLAIRFPRIGYVRQPIARYYAGRPNSLTSSESSSHDRSLVRFAQRGYAASQQLDEQRRTELQNFIDRISVHCSKHAFMTGHTAHGKWLFHEYCRIGVSFPWFMRLLAGLPESVSQSLIAGWRRWRDSGSPSR